MRPARERKTIEHPLLILNGVPFESVVTKLQNHPKMPLWLANEHNHRNHIRLVSLPNVRDAILDFICLEETLDNLGAWSNWYSDGGLEILTNEYCEKWLTMVRP